MASIRARRSFIKSTDLSSDVNPDSAVIIEDALEQMAQSLNRINDEEPSVTQCENKDCFDETPVYEDSYTLEHRPDDTEYIICFRENTKFWQLTSESGKSELNLTQMILNQFFSEITYDKLG